MSPTATIARPVTSPPRAPAEPRTHEEEWSSAELDESQPTGTPIATDTAKEQALFRTALAVLIERAGGQVEYTLADYRASSRGTAPTGSWASSTEQTPACP